MLFQHRCGVSPHGVACPPRVMLRRMRWFALRGEPPYPRGMQSKQAISPFLLGDKEILSNLMAAVNGRRADSLAPRPLPPGKAAHSPGPPALFCEFVQYSRSRTPGPEIIYLPEPCGRPPHSTRPSIHSKFFWTHPSPPCVFCAMICWFPIPHLSLEKKEQAIACSHVCLSRPNIRNPFPQQPPGSAARADTSAHRLQGHKAPSFRCAPPRCAHRGPAARRAAGRKAAR